MQLNGVKSVVMFILRVWKHSGERFLIPLFLAAATGLVCAFYALGRSLLATAVLWCLGFAAFSSLGEKVSCSTIRTRLKPVLIQIRTCLQIFMNTVFHFPKVSRRIGTPT